MAGCGAKACCGAVAWDEAGQLLIHGSAILPLTRPASDKPNTWYLSCMSVMHIACRQGPG